MFNRWMSINVTLRLHSAPAASNIHLKNSWTLIIDIDTTTTTTTGEQREVRREGEQKVFNLSSVCVFFQFSTFDSLSIFANSFALASSMDSYFTRIVSSLYATWRHIKTINRIDKVFFPPLFSLIAKLVLLVHTIQVIASPLNSLVGCRKMKESRKSRGMRSEREKVENKKQKLSPCLRWNLSIKNILLLRLNASNVSWCAAICVLWPEHTTCTVGLGGKREKGGIFAFANWLGRNANRFIGNFKAISACFNVELAVACPLRFVNAAAGAASISTRATRVNVTQLYTQHTTLHNFKSVADCVGQWKCCHCGKAEY